MPLGEEPFEGGVSAGPFADMGDAGKLPTGLMQGLGGIGQWTNRGLGIPELPSLPLQMGGLPLGIPIPGGVPIGTFTAGGAEEKGFSYRLEAEEWKEFFSLTDPQRVKELVRKRMEAVGSLWVKSARGFAPVDTGALRDSIDVRWHGESELEVGADVPYAGAVQGGTPPHWVPISALVGWANRHGIPAGALQRSIAHKGTQAHPFMEPAWNATGAQTEEIMGGMWDQVLEEGGLGKLVSGIGEALQDLGSE